MINITNSNWMSCYLLRPVHSHIMVKFCVGEEGEELLGTYKASNDLCEYDIFVDKDGNCYEWNSHYFWKFL